MGQACWQVATNGAYCIDVAIAGREFLVMIDLGLVDPRNQVGFALTPSDYDALKQTGLLTHGRSRVARDASGRYTTLQSALTAAQLIDPVSRTPVGPRVPIYVSRSTADVPNRVGVAFFHCLAGCRVVWTLDGRTWCVEYQEAEDG